MTGDVNKYHRILRDFLTTVVAVGKNGGREAWAPLYDQIYTFLEINTVEWCHMFLFQVLKKLDIDRERGCNIGNFMPQHFQAFLINFEKNWKLREKDGPSPHDRRGEGDDAGKSPGDGLPSHNLATNKDFIKPTKPGGAGEMRTQNGAVAYCNRWNQNQQCNRGLKSGPNKGMCAYTHACRWCKDGTDTHRAEDKDASGGWVCPNHP
jgi:hypothetical protein